MDDDDQGMRFWQEYQINEYREDAEDGYQRDDIGRIGNREKRINARHESSRNAIDSGNQETASFPF